MMALSELFFNSACPFDFRFDAGRLIPICTPTRMSHLCGTSKSACARLITSELLPIDVSHVGMINVDITLTSKFGYGSASSI